MTSQVTRIAVTPASSDTSYSLLPCVGQGDITGTKQPGKATFQELLTANGVAFLAIGKEIELVLHDEENTCELIQGSAMEIMDCVFPLVSDISITCSWQHALTGVDLLIILPCVSSRCHNTCTHLTTHGLSHAPEHMKVVFVGAKNHLSEFLSVNKTLTREQLLFIDISQSSMGPMSLANRICNNVRPWFGQKQKDNSHSANTADMMEVFAFPRL